jgi:hypothetical protein
MPIRKELRRYYGREWRAFRLALIAAHGAVCMACGRPTPRYLAAAHVAHDPRHSEVRLWCTSCHSRHDWRHSLAVRRRIRARRYGQLWLWAEVEYGVVAWIVPRRPAAAREEFQEGLFG